MAEKDTLTLREIAELFQEHLEARYPSCLWGIGGVDLRMLDGDIALHAQRTLRGKFIPGTLPGLAQCCQEASSVLPVLDGEARRYFQRSLALALAVYEYQATGAEQSPA